MHETKVVSNSRHVIEWKHVENAVAEQRPSLPDNEILRFKAIYRKFTGERAAKFDKMNDAGQTNVMKQRTALM